MTAIGSLVFCNDCGNLLPTTTTAKRKKLTCDVCGAKCKDTSARVTRTESKPSDFPSALRTKYSEVQAVDHDNIQQDATTQVPCEKCGNPEVRFYTLQLRSADEGTTVFYTCPKCAHKWNDNN